MSSHDFLLVLAGDNVMCFTADGCNTKLSCVSSARRHYKQRHENKKQSGSGITPNEPAAYVDPIFQAGNYVSAPQNNFNGAGGQVGYSENPTFQYRYQACLKKI